ncbi:hypothetical protein HK405_009736 [Cladochytrium tenue]|nr:hypothetical protein HK405_009736 [Cladochytrium tenue]
MRVAIVNEWGQPPHVADLPEPSAAVAGADLVDIRVEAVAVHQLVRARAAGLHYSTKQLPHVVGTDGVGHLDGHGLAYFTSMGGSFAEHVRLPRVAVAPLPEGADATQVAALTNPAMGAWMALRQAGAGKSGGLPASGWTLLVLGATSASGRIATLLARKLGATRVVGAARRADALAAVAGLDAGVVLAADPAATDFSAAGQPDVVIDYLAGAPAGAFLRYLAGAKLDTERPIKYVQVGNMAGPDVTVPAGLLRSTRLSVFGSGFGSWSPLELLKELPALVDAVAKLPAFGVRVEPIDKISEVWTEPAAPDTRLVFTF